MVHVFCWQGHILTVFTFITGTKALEDAGVSYDAIEQACVGYVYGKQQFNMMHPKKADRHVNMYLLMRS